MKYEKTLESRPYAPLVNPIPRLEMVIPMPGKWMDAMNDMGMDAGEVVSRLVCCRANYDVPAPFFIRDDWAEIWPEMAKYAVPYDEPWKRVLVPLRMDAWQCIEVAAEMVNHPVHEVFLKVLARQVMVYAERAEREITLSVSAAALDAVAAAGFSLEAAVQNVAPRDEKDLSWGINNWKSRSSRYGWSPRKILKWMQAAQSVRPTKLKIKAQQWNKIEQLAASVGITPGEWCLYAIGHRAALQMRKPRPK